MIDALSVLHFNPAARIGEADFKYFFILVNSLWMCPQASEPVKNII